MVYRFSEELAMRMENAELNRRMEREAAETATLDEIARIVTSAPEVGPVYNRFAAALSELIDFQRISINMIDLDRDGMAKRFLAGPIYSGLPRGNDLYHFGGQTQHLIDTGRTLIRDDIAGDLMMYPRDQRHLDSGLRSTIAVPVFSHDRVIGTICLRSPRVEAYGQREVLILERLAERIAPALENVMVTDRVQAREAELAALARDLEVATAAEGSDQFTSRHADLAHTLRSPFTSIKGYTSSLLRTDVSWSEELEREFLETIDREADRLNQAVTDLLDSSRHRDIPG